MLLFSSKVKILLSKPDIQVMYHCTEELKSSQQSEVTFWGQFVCSKLTDFLKVAFNLMAQYCYLYLYLVSRQALISNQAATLVLAVNMPVKIDFSFTSQGCWLLFCC